MKRLFLLGDTKETHSIASTAGVNFWGLYGVGMNEIMCILSSYKISSLTMYYNIYKITPQDEMVVFLTKDNYLSYLGSLFLLDGAAQDPDLLSRYRFVLCDFPASAFLVTSLTKIVGADKYLKLYANNSIDFVRLIDEINSDVFKKDLDSVGKSFLKMGAVSNIENAIRKNLGENK